MKAIQIEEFGGPEVLALPSSSRTRCQARARWWSRWRAAGSTSPTRMRPEMTTWQNRCCRLIPGAEVSGRTPDGRRVAALLMNGGYAERVAVEEASLIPIPDQVDDDQAAALLLGGLTAMALVGQCARVKPGEAVVVEAAAGGTGGLSVQLAKRAGARVIGLASSEEKRALVKRLGADAAVDSRAGDLGAAILEANGGEKVDAILHMSGGEAFDAELAVLAPLGRLVVFGIASREQRQVSTAALLRGSKSVIGFWLIHLLSRPELIALR